MSESRRRTSGFTLIEVMGALVIFAAGVLMVLNISGSLSRQMDRAAVTSELVVRAQERLDSLEALSFDSVIAGVESDIFLVRGGPFTRQVTVTRVTNVLYRFDVVIAPSDGGQPAYSASSYSADSW